MNNDDIYNQLEDGIIILQNLIKKYKTDKTIEIELRLGQIEIKSFKSGLNSIDFYNKIKDNLNSCKDWKSTTCITSEDIVNNEIRKTIFIGDNKIVKPICIKKQKLHKIDLTYDNTPYDIRIAISKEIPIDTKIKTGITRKKIRNSYIYKDYSLDLTRVITVDNTVSTETYEFELELLNLDNDVSDIYRAHSAFLLIRDVINMCETINIDSKLILDNVSISGLIESLKI